MQSIDIKKTISAYQWNGEEKGLPEGFHLCQPEAHYSYGGEYVYFTYADLPARHWITTTKFQEKPTADAITGGIEISLKDGSKYWRLTYSFAFYSIKSAASITRNHNARFLDRESDKELNEFLDFAALEGWGHSQDGQFKLPPRLEYRKTDGGYGRGYKVFYMKPTDWLVIDGEEIKVMTDEDFQKLQNV